MRFVPQFTRVLFVVVIRIEFDNVLLNCSSTKGNCHHPFHLTLHIKSTTTIYKKLETINDQMILKESIMSLLGTLFCRGGSTNDEKQSSSPTSNGIKNSKMNQFISIKFLYKNPIGRQLTVERFHRSEQSEICRAKDDPSLNNDPQLYEYINSIPNAIRWRGLLLQGYLVYGKVLKQIEQFEIRSDDIWLITYPKSGTTWMEEILSLIQSDCNIDTSKNTLIHERVPHLEVGKPLGHIKWLRGIGSPRLLATHLPIEHIPAQLRANKAKVST